MLPKNVLYYGKDEALPTRIPLRAGPLSLVYEEGDLRTVKLGDWEVLRRIYVAIRDRNWGTVLPVLSNIQMDMGEDAFRISYDVENKAGEIDFSWTGTITGTPQGTITFAMDGVAHSTFWRNRIGFCILHPAACAGTPCVIEHVDGATEQADLPTYIRADQPVQPFAELQVLTHQVAPGVWAQVRFSGDIFEMEDQRNWTDASFKTFCTPLRLPYPVQIEAGTRVVQTVTLTIKDERPEAGGPQPIGPLRGLVASPGEALSVTFSLDTASATKPLPPIGLGVASHGQPLSEREVARLKALHLHHLRVDLRFSDVNYPAALSRATTEARALGVPLEIAVFLSDKADEELRQFKHVLAEFKPPVATWLVYPAKELFWGGSPVNEALTLARQHLADYAPVARFGGGTNADFIFMQRSLPQLSLVDVLTFAILPQVHAFDNASVVETLEAQSATVTSALRLAEGLPVVVSPITFKLRQNYYATGPEPVTPLGQLPSQVDVRQMSLLGASWTAGSIKYMAESGAHSVTYFETTGWRGVMEVESGSPLPDQFRSLPGSVFPMYHILADVGEFSGGQVVPSKSSDNLKIDGLALRKDGRLRLLVANMSPQPQQVGVQRLSQQVRVRRLDETNAEQAMQSPEGFRAAVGETVQTRDGVLDLSLLPYAVACIDAA
jgi:hypothetical protein